MPLSLSGFPSTGSSDLYCKSRRITTKRLLSTLWQYWLVAAWFSIKCNADESKPSKDFFINKVKNTERRQHDTQQRLVIALYDAVNRHEVDNDLIFNVFEWNYLFLFCVVAHHCPNFRTVFNLNDLNLRKCNMMKTTWQHVKEVTRGKSCKDLTKQKQRKIHNKTKTF